MRATRIDHTNPSADVVRRVSDVAARETPGWTPRPTREALLDAGRALAGGPVRWGLPANGDAP
ncbi:hypothetical protein ACTOB_000157 [Actinoplanes oblitus]|uniref:Uncharacterized protein n=1 Tax=Actinoplanes oblitus TaxID=3040509 RepID=A0ABY8WGB2_9ACTN|nr:hypothetical protein [Actinoplanes oblitus]WIM96698.1 hypothetical protein ACTOB_000157 [Actinoplanes oblitus]